jgi:hypothetical protein
MEERDDIIGTAYESMGECFTSNSVGMGSKARKNRIKSKGQPRSVERTVPEA